MNFRLPKIYGPLILAIVFFAIPTLLFFLYPTSLWRVTDNETVGLGNAINMAYRLADRTFYPAPGITWHPGVTFYLMNWLALAIAGYPIATGGLVFFKTVIAHAEDYHRVIICLAAFVGATGVYIFALASQKQVPVVVTIVGLLMWLLSTPSTIMMFMSPGFESFAILLNGLFFLVLLRISYEHDLSFRTLLFAGGVGALAYLNKLSYIYIVMAIGAAILARLVACKVDWKRGAALLTVFVAAFALVIAAAARFVIGWAGFQTLYLYHKSIILGTGLYGTGDQTVVSGDEVRNAFAAAFNQQAYAIAVALICGIGLVIGGFITARRSKQHIPVAVLSIGTGMAALFSAMIVLKHYEIHYTAGVSATLPACVAAGFLLTKSWDHQDRRSYFAIGFVALASIFVASIAYPEATRLVSYVAGSAQTSDAAEADLKEINAQIAASKRTVEFTYKAPFAQFGEGFVLVIAEIPRLSEEYLAGSSSTISSFMARRIKPDVGIYVLDKGYFPDEEAIKSAPNLDLPAGSAPVVIKYNDGDKLIKLNTVFLLIRG
jgi:hypothetical protein